MFKEETLLNMLNINPSILNSNDPAQIFNEFTKIEEVINILKDSEKHFKETLKNMAEGAGDKDEKGSFTVRFPDGRWFKKEARTSVSIDTDRVMELDESRRFSFVRPSLTIVVDRKDEQGLLEVLESLSCAGFTELTFEHKIYEDQIEEAFQRGELTAEDLKEIIIRKTAYALTKSKSRG